jgi:GT2 family glycosyltransferase
VLEVPHGGRASAVNAGIAAATAPIVVLLDDDMEPVPTFLQSHLTAHRDGRRRAVVGAAPIRTVGEPAVVRYVGRKFNRNLRRLSDPAHRMSYREFYSGNLSAPVDLLREIGLFDTSFRVYGNEDGDLALRLLQAGAELCYVSSAMAHQHYLKSFAGLASDTREKGITAVQLAVKHPADAGALKLARFREGSRKWLVLRAALLAGAAAGLPVGNAVLGWVGLHERLGLPRLFLTYELALDFFYWLGARSELRRRAA